MNRALPPLGILRRAKKTISGPVLGNLYFFSRWTRLRVGVLRLMMGILKYAKQMEANKQY